MNPTPLDHLLGLFLLLAVPALGAWQFRRLKTRLAAGDADVRVRQYRTVLLHQLLLTGAVLALWFGFGRPWEALAPVTPAGWEPWAGWTGWALATIACVLLVVQAATIGHSEEGLAAARKQLEGMAPFLPREPRELRWFQRLSVAAGIGEEVVFRGFAIAWLAAVAASGLGLGAGGALAAAVLGSSAMFGLGHAYQGPAGIVRTGLVGLALAGLAVATGGLLAPMLVHTVVDLTSARIAYRAFRTGAPGAAGAATA